MESSLSVLTTQYFDHMMHTDNFTKSMCIYSGDISSGIIERDLVAPVFSLNVFEQCCTVLVVPLLYPVSVHFERAAVDEFTEVFDTIWIRFYCIYRNRRRIVIEKLQSMEKSHTNNKGLEKNRYHLVNKK